MRIAYIGDGESVHNHFMVDWFLRKGHEVLFLTDTPERFPFPEVQQSIAPRHGGGPLRHLYAAFRTRQWIRRWKPDIVHAHNVTGYGYWGALSGFSPLVMTAWGSDLLIHSRQNALIRWLVSYCLRKADLITGDAEDLCQLARTLSGRQVETRLLQWGVDLELFSHKPDEEFREDLRGDSEWVFLSTRRLRTIYNIDVILRAFSKALPSLPPSRLVVVGDDTQKKELENLAAVLSLTNNVLFTGWLPREKVIETLCASDVFLSVPSSDSTALSLLEAFAAGLPVIASDLPANREWIEPGQGGILIPPGDETLLANAMVELVRHPIRMQEWGKRNRRLVEERGNRQTEMLKLENWYRELIQRTQK